MLSNSSYARVIFAHLHNMTAKDIEPFLGLPCTIRTTEREYKGVAGQLVEVGALEFLETVHPHGVTTSQRRVLIEIATIERIENALTRQATEKKPDGQ